MVTRHRAGSLVVILKVGSNNNVPFVTLLGTAYPLLACLFLGFCAVGLDGLGYTSTIAASYGSLEQVCAIEANGEQGVLCWGNSSSSGSPQGGYPSSTPLAFSVLSGGNGFMCGLRAGTGSPYCWVGGFENATLIPETFWNTSYTTIAAGETHACAIRAVPNGSGRGNVECWGQSLEGGEIYPPTQLSPMASLVAGRRFTCGLDKYTHYPRCWGGPAQAGAITDSAPDLPFQSLSAGTHHVCGIVRGSGRVKCWGDNSVGQSGPPEDVSFSAVTAGMYHSCGIMELTHEVRCWGLQPAASPAGVSFLALTSALNLSCGIREDSLLAMCWGADAAAARAYSPPLQLFSPGICSPTPCGSGTFAFNASAVMDLAAASASNVCMGAGDRICAPCAQACPAGTFLSRPCAADADRHCTDCAFCLEDRCRAVCGAEAGAFPAASPLQSKSSSGGERNRAAPIVGAAVAGGVAVAVLGALVLCVIYRKQVRHRLWTCATREKLMDSGALSGEAHGRGCSALPLGGKGGFGHGGGGGGLGGGSTPRDIVRMRTFRLSELRDATNGFKELNELGRGSYGFVYKAVLADGRLVAVKRANAARRIESREADFEAELEVLCKVHHAHLVNLVGYCKEMGERLLVFDYMPNGTLYDRLHGGLAQLSWSMRLRVAAQAARGIEYLHKDASPRIIHKDIKSCNVLLDGEWGARVADFGLAPAERDRGANSSSSPSDVAYVDPEYMISQTYTEKSDVYSFGVVLLEILCGRKAYDKDFRPPNIVEWATPHIRRGQSKQILDRNLGLPKNCEPLMRVAEIVELCVRCNPQERPSMTDVAAWLEIVCRSSSL